MIDSTTDQTRNLTIHVATGTVSSAEIVARIESFYAGKPTLHVIWDLTQADVTGVPATALQSMMDQAVRLAHSREGGRTAIVADDDLAYGLGRVVESIGQLSRHPAPIRPFRTRDEALRWVMEAGASAPADER